MFVKMRSLSRLAKQYQVVLFMLYCVLLSFIYLYRAGYFSSQMECFEPLEKREDERPKDQPPGDVNPGQPQEEENRPGVIKLPEPDPKREVPQEPKERCFKQIQIWTNKFHWTDSGRTDYTCPGLPCNVRQIEDTSFETMEKSDAVLFHYLSEWDWDEVHKHKKPGQKWIFSSAQSPVNTKRLVIPPKKYYNNTYDYIMSYRKHERNLFGDFGKLTKKESGSQDGVNWAEGKTRLAAWTGRDCNGSYVKWKRMQFIQDMAKLAQVDVYGKCGEEECESFSPGCYAKLRRHKFYLAFENCKCRNFISEVWDNAILNNVVPVVYGPPREDYELVLPVGSFIHVEQFPNLQKLVDFLLMLNRNDDLYNTYFEWKKHWQVESYRERHLLNPSAMCQVVERLLEDEKAVKEGTFKPMTPPDWESWWFGSCDDSKHIPL